MRMTVTNNGAWNGDSQSLSNSGPFLPQFKPFERVLVRESQSLSIQVVSYKTDVYGIITERIVSQSLFTSGRFLQQGKGPHCLFVQEVSVPF